MGYAEGRPGALAGGDDRWRVIDWGDAMVAHPFATLRITLASLAEELGVDWRDATLRPVVDAYLEPWRGVGVSERALWRQVELTYRLAAIGRAGGWIRAVGSPEVAASIGHAGAVAGWLARLLED